MLKKRMARVQSGTRRDDRCTSRMIKVLAVMDGTGTGGAETSMAAMAPLMAEHGVDFEVAYFYDRPGAKEKFVEAGIPLIHVPHGRSRLLTVWRLRRVIKERRPDVVHTMVYEADIIGRTAAFLARVPVMSSIINEMYGAEQLAASAHPWKMRMAQLTDIATARFVRQFHAITHTVADVMAPRLRIDRSKIVVVYRGRDHQRLGRRSDERRARIRGELGITDEQPLLLAVGRQERQKGFDLLLEAMPALGSELPDVRLLIAGRRGSASDALERQQRRLGLDGTVRWLGHRGDVPDLLVACDVMVFPSRWEGLGSAVIEAIMLETPVVCSNLAVLREVVGAAKADAWVSLVDAADPPALVSALVAAMEERPLGPASVRDLTPFLVGTVVAGYCHIIRGCVGGERLPDSDDIDDMKSGSPRFGVQRRPLRAGGE